jgi:alpha-L-fucosidase
MELFAAAGGKYFVAQAVHHDNFDNFDSTHNRWNSVNVGPHKDIVGLWKHAAQSHGLPFGITEHLAASFNWWGTNKGADKKGPYAGVPYDGNDPEYLDFYYNNKGYSIDESEGGRWYTDNLSFHEHWFNRVKDMIDKYHPDLLYSDGPLPFGQFGEKIVAHLYNTSVADHGQNLAVYNQKDTNPDIYTVGVLDIERGQMDEIAEHPWQTDTSVGDWFYNVKDVYKTPEHVIESLIDIGSKNGCLLLNIPQRPDGTLDDECTYLLKQMALWVNINGEGVFGTRPWIVAGEGPAASPKGAFNEKPIEWTAQDFRFAQKGDTLYVFQMRRPESRSAIIRSLAAGKSRPVSSARLLGYGPAKFEQAMDGLNITLPDAQLPLGPHCIALTLE